MENISPAPDSAAHAAEAARVAAGVNRSIRARMALQGMSQRQLADALGMKPTTFNQRLLGNRSWKVTELAVVAAVLGCSFGDLSSGQVPTDPANTPGQLAEQPPAAPEQPAAPTDV